MSDSLGIHRLTPTQGEGVPRASRKEAGIQKRDIADEKPGWSLSRRNKRKNNEEENNPSRGQQDPDTRPESPPKQEDNIIDIII